MVAFVSTVSTGATVAGTTGSTGATAGATVGVAVSAVQLRGPLVAFALATTVAWSPKSQQAVESSEPCYAMRKCGAFMSKTQGISRVDKLILGGSSLFVSRLKPQL